MIKRALHKGRVDVRYTGFDLFEDLTQELAVKEKSKTKLPPSRDKVSKKMREETAADIELWKGFTSKTLPAFVATTVKGVFWDLIYIDGGHALETIDSDWNSVGPIIGPKTVVIFDDYYPDRDDFGCQQLIKRLKYDLAWKVEFLEPVDHYEHTKTTVQFVKVTRS